MTEWYEKRKVIGFGSSPWTSLCKPFGEGALGIKPLSSVMAAMHAKLAWSYIQGTSLWPSFMRAMVSQILRSTFQRAE